MLSVLDANKRWLWCYVEIDFCVETISKYRYQVVRASVVEKKFDKNLKIWYHINRSLNIHGLFEKFLAMAIAFESYTCPVLKELDLYYAKCTICLSEVSTVLLGL